MRIKIRYSQGFQTQTAQIKASQGIQDSATLFELATGLFPRFDLNRPMRLVGLAAFELVPETDCTQMGLFHQKDAQTKRERLEKLGDAIETKFGTSVMRKPDTLL